MIGFYLNNFLVKLPIKFPNFNLNILSVTAEDNRVLLHVKYTADNLNAESVHMFVVAHILRRTGHPRRLEPDRVGERAPGRLRLLGPAAPARRSERL